MQTVTLWRPVGPEELALIKESDMMAFPPRLPDQPIFYPVTSEDYAIKIARDWNVRANGVGYVTRFDVKKEFLDAFKIEDAGGRAHQDIGFPPNNFRDSTKLLSAESRSWRHSRESKSTVQ
jgi:hypothetical protein